MFTIRKFKPNDFLPLIKLSYETLPEQYNPHVFLQVYEACPQGLLVAEHNQQIIGFIMGAKTQDNKAVILTLSVAPDQRRKGIGSTLLQRFLKEMALQGIKKTELQVRVDNTTAIKFYKKHGFKITDTLPAFYENNKDGYSMMKTL